MKSGPERALVDDYVARAAKLGRGLGVRSVQEIEVEAGGGAQKEAERLLSKAGDAHIIRLDEDGRSQTSRALASDLAQRRDAGENLAFLIGGADGFDKALKSKTPHALSFGAQTWPHKLVRVLIAEQIYRALSIDAGAPYHRD